MGAGAVTLSDPGNTERQKCDSPRTRLAGRLQKFIAGLRCREADLDRYCLLGDDTLAADDAATSAFLRTRHGAEYIMLGENKRRSRNGCRKRGCIWEREREFAP